LVLGEVIELSRKLVLSGLIGLFQRGSIAQTVLAPLVSFFFFSTTVRAQPFALRHLNIIKVMSEIQLFVILLCCVMLQTHEQGFATEVITEDDYGTIQVVVTVLAIPISVYLVLTALIALLSFPTEDERTGATTDSHASSVQENAKETNNPLMDLDEHSDAEDRSSTPQSEAIVRSESYDQDAQE
jgi:hypothetical protein